MSTEQISSLTQALVEYILFNSEYPDFTCTPEQEEEIKSVLIDYQSEFNSLESTSEGLTIGSEIQDEKLMERLEETIADILE